MTYYRIGYFITYDHKVYKIIQEDKTDNFMKCYELKSIERSPHKRYYDMCKKKFTYKVLWHKLRWIDVQAVEYDEIIYPLNQEFYDNLWNELKSRSSFHHYSMYDNITYNYMNKNMNIPYLR